MLFVEKGQNTNDVYGFEHEFTTTDQMSWKLKTEKQNIIKNEKRDNFFFKLSLLFVKIYEGKGLDFFKRFV